MESRCKYCIMKMAKNTSHTGITFMIRPIKRWVVTGLPLYLCICLMYKKAGRRCFLSPRVFHVTNLDGNKLTDDTTINCIKQDKESWDMTTTQEKIDAASKKKEEGNAFFKAGKYLKAVKRYEKAAKYIEYDTNFEEEEKKQAKALKITCNLNNAACQLKLKDYK